MPKLNKCAHNNKQRGFFLPPFDFKPKYLFMYLREIYLVATYSTSLGLSYVK